MNLMAGVGESKMRDPVEAGRDAVAKAFKNAGIDKCDFVMLYATVGYDQKSLLKAVREATHNVPLSGCSVEGIITRNLRTEENHAVSVMVWKSDKLKFKNVLATGVKDSSEAAGEDIATKLGVELPKNSLALFMLPDGLTFNFDGFSRGFKKTAKFSQSIKWVGGQAGDNFSQTKTYQYHNDEIVSEGIACALLYGDGEIIVDHSHGCSALGRERTITRATGNVIFEIDGKPALDVMNEYLSTDEINNFGLSMISLCLGFNSPKGLKGHDDQIIRVIPSRDDKARSISIYTEVAAGTKVWMTRRNPEKMMAGIHQLKDRMMDQLKNKNPQAVFQFECMGRGKHMFRDEEVSRLQETLFTSLGREIPWIGFYAYGEIAPVGGENFQHNYTTVLCAIAG